MTDNPLLSAHRQIEDADAALRPKTLAEFVGQAAAKDNLRVFIESAKSRGEAMDHVLFYGPPGLGKTTLAQIVARELGVGFRATSGPVIAKSGDLAALLTNLEAGDVLFIDEIHRMSPVVEEVLYPAMEDRALDLMIGEGPSARSVRIDLPPFTLVGATTRAGLLTTPLRDRFGIPVRLNFYTIDELERVVTRGAGLLGVGIESGGARLLPSSDLRPAADLAPGLLRKSPDAFARLDTKAAVDILKEDDQIDREFDGFVRKLITYMMEDPRTISASLDLLFLAKAIERIGDHSKNISELIIYLVEGQDVRHRALSDIESVLR